MIRRTFIASLLALPGVLLLKPRNLIAKNTRKESFEDGEQILLYQRDDGEWETNIVRAPNISNRTIQKGEPVYWAFDNATARWGVVGCNPGVMPNVETL